MSMHAVLQVSSDHVPIIKAEMPETRYQGRFCVSGVNSPHCHAEIRDGQPALPPEQEWRLSGILLSVKQCLTGSSRL
jgi:hypothetical protein